MLLSADEIAPIGSAPHPRRQQEDACAEVVRDLLELGAGSVVELDRSAGTPVDVLVNGTIVARGEVVVVDDELGVRVTEVIKGDNGVPS